MAKGLNGVLNFTTFFSADYQTYDSLILTFDKNTLIEGDY